MTREEAAKALAIRLGWLTERTSDWRGDNARRNRHTDEIQHLLLALTSEGAATRCPDCSGALHDGNCFTPKPTPPRYDSVYHEGTAALDAEARGEPTPPAAMARDEIIAARDAEIERLWEKLAFERDHGQAGFNALENRNRERDDLRRQLEEARAEREQRCIKHGAMNPDGDCVYCDHEIERDRAEAAEAALDRVRALVAKHASYTAVYDFAGDVADALDIDREPEEKP